MMKSNFRLLCILCMLCLLTALPGWAQNTYSSLPYLPVQFSRDSGAPVSLGWVCTYAAGTTNKLATYTTPSGTAHANPIHLDAAGRPPGNGIYLAAASYKINLYASGTGNLCGSDVVGALIKSVDNVQDIGQVASQALNLNNERICSRYPGANAGAQITACIADLPSTGGTADARGFEGAQTATATITINKPARLLLGAMTLTSNASPVFDVTVAGSSIEGQSNPAAFSIAHTTKLITSHGTGDVIRTSAKSTRVSHLSLSASGAKTAGAGLHAATGTQIEADGVTIEPVWNGVQMDGGSSGFFRNLLFGADASTPAAANWNAAIYLKGDPLGVGVVTDTSFFHPIISVDRAMASGGAIYLNTGTDSITFWNPESITTGTCRTTDCGAVILTTNSTPTTTDPPRTIRFFGGIFESGTLNVGIDIQTCKDCVFQGSNIDNALIGIRVAEITSAGLNPGGFKFLNGRILQTIQQGVLLNGGTHTFIQGNRIGGVSSVASTYPAIEVAANVIGFHIDDNLFVPSFSYSFFPTYFVQVNAGGSDVYTVTRNTMPSTGRVTGNILDGGTGLNKIIGPNNGDVAPYNNMSIYGSYISTASIGTAPLVVTSTTPVANLHGYQSAYSQAGGQWINAHLSTTGGSLSGGTATVTWTGASAFVNTAYLCWLGAKGANPLYYTILSATQTTVTGTGTDAYTLFCYGN